MAARQSARRSHAFAILMTFSRTSLLSTTDATLTPAQTKRLANMAQDGGARAVYPAHLPRDGDTIFGVSAGERALEEEGIR